MKASSPIKGIHMWIETAALTIFLVALGMSTLPADDKPGQHVVIDKTIQTLSAYENGRLVLRSRVSTGKADKSTPNGSFESGVKFRMHYSRLYHHAPMPYSVQVTGNVFIHGYSDVPAWPASHGCIRVPLDGDNPAKRFFEWVKIGARIDIIGHWQAKPPNSGKRLTFGGQREISQAPNLENRGRRRFPSSTTKNLYEKRYQ